MDRATLRYLSKRGFLGLIYAPAARRGFKNHIAILIQSLNDTAESGFNNIGLCFWITEHCCEHFIGDPLDCPEGRGDGGTIRQQSAFGSLLDEYPARKLAVSDAISRSQEDTHLGMLGIDQRPDLGIYIAFQFRNSGGDAGAAVCSHNTRLNHRKGMMVAARLPMPETVPSVLAVSFVKYGVVVAVLGELTPVIACM